MSLNQEKRRDAGLSATMLTNFCPRKVILEQEEDYYEFPIKNGWPKLRGSIYHTLMEEYGDGIGPNFSEIRLKKTISVDGVDFEITGQPDLYLIDHGLLIDYKSSADTSKKTKAVSKNLAQQDHIEQVQIYRWLLDGGYRVDNGEQVNYEVRIAGIVYFDMMTFKKISVPLWPMDAVEEFIEDRVRPFVEYKKTNILPPIADDGFGSRHILCNYCSLRDHCDRRESEDAFD